MIIANSYKETDVAAPSQRQLRYLPSAVKDADKLKQAFEYLKFFAVVKYNMTKSELVSFLLSLAHNPHVQICHRFVFAFYGHGDNNIVYCEDGSAIQVSVILNIISNHDSLKNIPRLFFFDISQDPKSIAKETEKWQPKIIDNVIVAFSTSPGSHRYLDGRGSSLWTVILAKKLVTSPQDIRCVIVETNEELYATIEPPIFGRQLPQLFGRLNTTICLLIESGKQPCS